MRLTRWTLTLAVLPISACFSGDIDVVKKFVPEETPRYSLDQLLTPRKSCSKTSWTTLSDDRGRKIVEYACVYAPAKDYLQELTARTREKEQENKAASKRAGEQVLKDKQRELQRLYEQLQEAKELIARAHLPSEALKQLQSDLTVASNIASCSSIPVDQFKHPTIITRAQQTISKCQDRESDVTRACSRTDKAWAGACNYVRSQAQSGMVQDLREFASTVQQYLEIEQRRAPESLAAAQRNIQRIEASIPSYEEEVQKQDISNKESLTQREAQAERINAWLTRRSDSFKGVTEISQWTVVNGSPVYVGSRVDVAFGDSKAGTDVPLEFVLRNALDNGTKVSSFYQVLLDRLFANFEGGFK